MSHVLKIHRLRSRQLRVLALILSAVPVVACGEKYPSEADAREVFTSHWQPRVDSGLVEVVDFAKVNAQQVEPLGVPTYSVDYKAVVRWPKGLNAGCLTPEGRVRSILPGTSMFCMALEVRKVGKVDTLTGSVDFEKSEKGWKAENGKVY